MAKVSIIIIATREAPHLEAAEKSAAWADQVLVDIHSTPITDFAAIRNQAAAKADNDWIFFLDSDEKISTQLRRSILTTLKNPNQSVAFAVLRRDMGWGEELRWGEPGMSKLIRLFNRNIVQYQGKVHETPTGYESIERLGGYLLHQPHADLSGFIQKVLYYAQAAAESKLKTDQSFSLWQLLLLPLVKFWYNWIGKLGLLDGMRGFNYAFMMSLHSLIVRVTLYEKTRSTHHE
jgi:hypothetical protein